MAKSTKPLESTDATDTTIEAVAVDQIRVLDVTPSPEDSRDWSAEGLLAVAKYPPTLDLRQYCQPVRDQRPQGACAAMAGSARKHRNPKTTNCVNISAHSTSTTCAKTRHQVVCTCAI